MKNTSVGNGNKLSGLRDAKLHKPDPHARKHDHNYQSKLFLIVLW
jgi:hypothetical protein